MGKKLEAYKKALRAKLRTAAVEANLDTLASTRALDTARRLGVEDGIDKAVALLEGVWLAN